MVIQFIIKGPEQHREVVLAYLVKSAVNARREVIGEEVSTIDEFFSMKHEYHYGRRCGGRKGIPAGRSRGSDTKRGVERRHAFLRTFLTIQPCFWNHCLRWERYNGGSFHDILSCFWSNRLDTCCHTCHQPIVDGPPIRTIARYETNSPSASNVHLQIFNRHFSCLKTKCTFFVPVSHVWDDSIRIDKISKTHNDKAASTLISTLEALFNGAENSYDPGVEFWRDYFSVTQRETVIKESLLLCIPAIYHFSEEILVSMSDLPAHYVPPLLLGEMIGSELSLNLALMAIHPLRTLCNSQF